MNLFHTVHHTAQHSTGPAKGNTLLSIGGFYPHNHSENMCTAYTQTSTVSLYSTLVVSRFRHMFSEWFINTERCNDDSLVQQSVDGLGGQVGVLAGGAVLVSVAQPPLCQEQVHKLKDRGRHVPHIIA